MVFFSLFYSFLGFFAQPWFSGISNGISHRFLNGGRALASLGFGFMGDSF